MMYMNVCVPAGWPEEHLGKIDKRALGERFKPSRCEGSKCSFARVRIGLKHLCGC